MTGQCAFCDRTASLRDSHVLPAFTYRALREFGATGYIRHTDSPNQRVQDGLKKPWLCDDCENLFSKDEAAFASQAFYPLLKEPKLHVQYRAWMLRFCVSVSWRVLKFARGYNKNATYSDVQNILMDKAEARWRAFLNNGVEHPGEFEQHLLHFELIESTSVDDLPVNINRFMSGAITLDIVGSSRSLMTFAKLGPFMIFGLIQKGPEKWDGSKIHVRKGTLKPGDFVVPAGLLPLFKEKAAIMENAMKLVSPIQLEKVDATVRNNLDRFSQSRQFSAMRADAKLFGEEVILRKPTPESD